MKRRTFHGGRPDGGHGSVAGNGAGWLRLARSAGQDHQRGHVPPSRQEAIEPLIPEFEELTGIKVNLTAPPEEQYRPRRWPISPAACSRRMSS